MTSMWTGVSGLKVNQTSLNTTAHNLSNIETKGYVRQQVLLTDNIYNNMGSNHISTYQIGLGTSMQEIRQVRDVFIDKSYRLETGRQEFYQVQSDAATEIEAILGEFGDSTFAATIDDLWSALSGVAEEPDSIVKRSILASTASTFISYAELLKDQLYEYQNKINDKIQSQVDRINEIGDEIKVLNTEIVYQEASGQNANDYRDRRNVLLDELATYVNITYSEDYDGRVSVNIEGTQFVTQDRVFHIKTEEIIDPAEQELADDMDELIQQMLKEIEELVGAGKTGEDLITALRNATSPLDKDKTFGETGASAWSIMSQYGSLEAKYDDSGVYTINFNDMMLIKTEGGDLDADTTEYIDYEPKSTGFQNVVWANTGIDVFRLTGEYASFNNTDVGSLKSILIARGNYSANYTDVPQKADYYVTDEDGNQTFEQEAYDAAVKKFNEDIDACLLTSTQAQIDTLVHNIVTAINDALCPNMDLTEESIAKTIELSNGGTDTEAATITINGSTYTIEQAKEAGFQILNLANTSVGMDEDSTIGEVLFNRKNMERYTLATLKDGEGKAIKDANGNEIQVYVYNQEYDTNLYSQFTIGQIEVNQDILDDVSKMPLSYSKYSELYGGYNFEVCQQILKLWETDSIQISPNVLTAYNFTDYYDAIAGNVATMGGLYGEKLDMLEETTAAIGNSRESILGVASEEELTNLITFQHAYNASSRYINAINELLQTVINIGN